MRFYKLTHSYYETDHDDNEANPIRLIQDIWLPGLICSECGEIWAGSRRLYLPITDPALRQKLHGKPLPEVEWIKLANAVRAALDLSDSFLLRPGDVLGMPVIELLSGGIHDFLHPFPGQIIVKAPVIDALQRAELTGFQPISVEVHWSKGLKHPTEEPPTLYELMVTGTAWRAGMNEDRITACEHCGRKVFPNPDWLVVDESRWDGSDFFHVDRNPNIILVTERVCKVLAQHDFTNYACIPVTSDPHK